MRIAPFLSLAFAALTCTCSGSERTANPTPTPRASNTPSPSAPDDTPTPPSTRPPTPSATPTAVASRTPSPTPTRPPTRPPATPTAVASPTATPPPPDPCAGVSPVAGMPADLRATVIATGLSRPLGFRTLPGSPGVSLVIEQAGRIRRFANGRVGDVWLDVRNRASRVSGYSERGLFDIAFHPDFPRERRVFVHYTDRGGDTVVSEMRLNAAGTALDADTERVVLQVSQPYSNHNGGAIEFGPDRMLYIGLGDGGSGGDPQGNGQDLGVLLAKILRIDPDGRTVDNRYGIPAGNPFAQRAGARAEVFHYGLRNPWRFAFDPPTGHLYIGDVGQDSWEEIDVAPRGAAGLNFGWNTMEGEVCYDARSCNRDGLTAPIAVYRNAGDTDCSVTGGVVYRGCAMPALHGHYFYADWCSGKLRSLRFDNGTTSDRREWTSGLYSGTRPLVTAIGTDPQGEMVLVDGDGGRLLRIEPR